ncbi:hypothetical protein BD324DRAFT_613295 [Kockovaella imperatae]|uniref:NADH:ubiquinone reductase (non-electrogenic) n=1 Tax=Kockovaella imperatae TaxID=4999 RepID=A0A1Y1UT47_9TREE|nr:hypothetical protein BD324DRAFT_613295 [Kockovaella imperatae]ORX41122.1 hypothetical protein BD324DRAFT_613295 [Kockovaella imperatae]
MSVRYLSHSSPIARGILRGQLSLSGKPNVAPRLISLKSFSTSGLRANVVPPEPVVVPVTPNAPKPSFGQRWRRRVRAFARTVLVVILVGGGAFYYVTQQDVHPGDQLPSDPSKPTLVVLGSGWGATSFLKNLDTEEFNVVVVSPRNYFLFSPLLPSVTVGTLEPRSIIQPTRFITRHKKRKVSVYEAEAREVDPIKKTVTFRDQTDIRGEAGSVTIPYDYLVYAVGCENQTFGIEGVTKYGCFLKELSDADKIRTRLMDCIETAAFKDQPDEEVDRLMHMVVVGGGPTGVEYAGELHDFLIDDLRKWYPEVADRLRITLIEALPNVLPAFSKQLIQYTESQFKENRIDVLTRTMVKDVKERSVVVQDANKEIREIPYGLLVWATGNTSRQITKNLLAKLPETQTQKRGIVVDDYLSMLGAEGVYAIGDCTATQYAPTAQVASQQGAFLAQMFGKLGQKAKLQRQLADLRASSSDPVELEAVVKKLNRVAKLTPFHYSHQGSLAYIGSEKAIADLPFFNGNVASGGGAAMLFWRSAYISTLYSVRNRTLVMTDWLKVKLFGRDVSRE